MNTLTMNSNANLIPTTDLQPALFNEFISFVDRSNSTAIAYIKNLRQFAAWLKYEAISRPIRQDIISYRQYLTEEHEAIQLDNESISGWSYRTDANGSRIVIKCKPNTVKVYLQSVSQFFKWTASEGLYPNIADNIHAPKVRQSIHKKDALTANDVLKIENSIIKNADSKSINAAAYKKDTQGRINRATEQGKRLYAMYMLAVNAGLRTVELSRATIKDLETKDGNTYLYIWGKGHTEADTKKILAPAVADAITDYLNSRTDAKTNNSPLFVSTGNRSKGKKIATTTISTMLKEAMKEAGYNSDRLTAHSLRHTAGTTVMDVTNNLYTAQHYMRHSNPATTEIYLHNDITAQDAQTAQAVYNKYHNINAVSDNRSKLDNIISLMDAEQIAELTKMAALIAK